MKFMQYKQCFTGRLDGEIGCLCDRRVCVCLCMCVYMHVCVCMCACVCMCVCADELGYMHAFLCVYIYVCVSVCMHACVCWCGCAIFLWDWVIMNYFGFICEFLEKKLYLSYIILQFK